MNCEQRRSSCTATDMEKRRVIEVKPGGINALISVIEGACL